MKIILTALLACALLSTNSFAADFPTGELGNNVAKLIKEVSVRTNQKQDLLVELTDKISKGNFLPSQLSGFHLNQWSFERGYTGATAKILSSFSIISILNGDKNSKFLEDLYGELEKRHGNVEYNFSLGFLGITSTLKCKLSYLNSIKQLEHAAKQGHAGANYWLGLIYRTGLIQQKVVLATNTTQDPFFDNLFKEEIDIILVKKDMNKANEFIEAAKKAGHSLAEAGYYLSSNHQDGSAIELKELLQLYRSIFAPESDLYYESPTLDKLFKKYGYSSITRRLI